VYLTEFQVESPSEIAGRWRNRSEVFGPTRARAAIESLLLSSRFRSYLSNSERELLDNLAIDNTIAFLLQGVAFLHPSEFAPVPVSQVQASVQAAGDAMFVQQYQPHGDRHASSRKLYTARIGTTDRGDIVLGMLGPMANGDRERQFEYLVGEFRGAWKTSAEATEIVKATLAGQPRSMVVNRASGRVIVATDQLAEMLGVKPGQLVDAEFSQAKMALRERLIGHRLTLRNIESNGMYLCLVTLAPQTEESAQAGSLQRTSRFLIHTMRNKLAAISVASGHLQEQRHQLTERESAELTQIVGSQIDLLDRHLERLGLLINYPSYQSEPRPVRSEVDRIGKALREEFSGIVVAMDCSSSDLSIMAPRPALGFLLDAILRSHTLRCREKCRHDSTVAGSRTGVSIEVNTTPAESSPTLAIETQWWDFAEHLSQRMSGVLERHAESLPHAVRTTLFLPTTPTPSHEEDGLA